MALLKKTFVFRKGIIPYCFIIVGFNLLLLKFSLSSVFGYEFSVLNSILLTLLSGFHSLDFLKHKIEEYDYSLRLLFVNLSIFILIPLIISLANSYLNGFCSFVDGLFFYIVILTPSVLVGMGLSVVSILISRKFSRTIFFIIFLIILFIPVLEIYFNPQVYFYNPIVGFFPGNIYDEGLTVSASLILYRALNIFYFGSIIISFLIYAAKYSAVKRVLFLSITAIVASGFIYFSPLIGLTTTEKSLSNELKFGISTEHFDIKYSSKLNASEIKILAIRHELYYEELKNFFNYKPNKKIKSFIFSNTDQKKKLFGAGNADVAKPWLMQIYLTYDNYDGTLKHEIAHCFTAEFGSTIFKIADNFNAALIEGAAVAGDPYYDDYPVDYMAALAYQNGYKINLGSLFESFNFFFQPSSLSYIYAGSFSKYLIDNYGITKFKRLYSNIDFQSVYGKYLPDLISEYYAHLSIFEVSNKKPMADFYFGRKPIFSKVCPRYISDRLAKAWNLFQQEKYSESLALFSDVIGKSENYSAIIGYASCLFETNRKNEAIKFLKNKVNNFYGTSNFYQMKFTLADFMSEVNQTEKSNLIYKEIFDSSSNRTLDYLALTRSSLIKNEFGLPAYLTGSDTLKYEVLKKMNKQDYNYYSFPILINLSKRLGEDYNEFLKIFDKSFLVENTFRSYALFKFSEYMFENLDFINARKTAALAFRFASEDYEKQILSNYFEEVNWVINNSQSLL